MRWRGSGTRCGSFSRASGAGGQARFPGAGHLFAATRRHGVFRPQPGGLNQAGDHAANGGGHDTKRARTGLRRWVSLLLDGQAADSSVPEAVVDEGEKLAGRRHPADILAPPIGDAVLVGPDRCRAPLARRGLDRGPADQAAALLICGPGQCQEMVAGPSGRVSGAGGLVSCQCRAFRAALMCAPVAARTGRSRPGRRPARRGSLDGPVSCRQHNGSRSPPGLLGSAVAVLGALLSVR